MEMRARLLAVAAVSALALALSEAPAVAASPSTTPLPVIYNGIYGYAHVSSTASPPGANNWSCKPSVAHPYPVILVHGTFGDMSDSWQALSPLLYDNSYCVFALNYGSYNGSGSLGIYATGPIEQSARLLSRFVDRVLAATCASKVALVGPSTGGLMPRFLLEVL